MINRRKQRLHYLISVVNDINIAGYTSESNRILFDQIAGGKKLFKETWAKSIWLRLIVNLLLPITMLGYDVFALLKYSLRSITHRKKKIHPDNLFVSVHNRLYSVGTFAGLIKDDSVWFATPFDCFELPQKYTVITVFDYLSISDVFLCVIQSIQCHLFCIWKFGYKSYLLSQRAFLWMITDVALRKTPDDIELVFANNSDRLAILFDYLPHKKKSLVQHGALHFYHIPFPNDSRFTYLQDNGFWIWNCLFRFHHLTRMYCYSETDKIAYQKSNISCNPDYVIIGYTFKPAFKPSKKSVLIIAHPLHFLAEEEIILRQLDGLDIELYLKNHPTASDEYYNELRRGYNFVFLSGMTKELPQADIVFSYESSLAYEYEALGTKVFYYYTFEWNDIRKLVNDYLSI